MLGPVFWRTTDPPTMTAYPHGWPQRIAADVQREDRFRLGGILHNPYRVRWIANGQDWQRLMDRTLCRYPMPERKAT